MINIATICPQMHNGKITIPETTIDKSMIHAYLVDQDSTDGIWMNLKLAREIVAILEAQEKS